KVPNHQLQQSQTKVHKVQNPKTNNSSFDKNFKTLKQKFQQQFLQTKFRFPQTKCETKTNKENKKKIMDQGFVSGSIHCTIHGQTTKYPQRNRTKPTTNLPSSSNHLCQWKHPLHHPWLLQHPHNTM
ncbi:hypothetical protein V8G54_018032, partial [Vigna mungo]